MAKIIIGVDIRELTNHPAGKGQYLGRVLESWLTSDSLFNLVLYVKEGASLPIFYHQLFNDNRVSVVKVAGRGPLWHLAVSRRLAKDKVKVFFAALSYQSAIFNKIPTVTVVHDLAVFRLRQTDNNRRSEITEKLSLRYCLKNSASVIAVSESTARDLVKIFPQSKAKIQVIKEAPLLSGKGSREAKKEFSRLPRDEREPYLLFVGTLEPRKNINNMLKAYSLLPEDLRAKYRLKLVGKNGWGKESYPSTVRDLNLVDRVDFIGYVEEEKLPEIFARALLFMYLSLYEGFGLPVVEAMAFGTPVVASDTSSLPEVLGNQDLLVSPNDPVGIATIMEKLLRDPEYWEKASKASFERAKTFCWTEISQAILAVLAKAI
jgi:glycosyltransferase involved in cell wall biosynthesis